MSSFDAGALIFKIQTAGQQTFESEMAAADRSVEKLGRSSAESTPKVERVGTAVDGTGKKAREAKAPLDEQAKSTKKVGDESDDAAKKQQKQATSSQEQVAAARELSSALLITGTAVTAVVALSVARYAEFDAAMSQTRAATMATASEQRELADAALEAGADTAYSATEAANAQEELAKAGLSVSEIVGGSLNGALALAAAGQLEVARSAEIMATTLTQFKLPASDAARVADVLAAGAGKAQGSVDDLALALSYVGPLANQAGWSVEETGGAIAYFASQGILGEKAGTSLRGVLAALQSPSAIAKRTMDEYGISIYDAQGNMLGAAGVADQLKNAFSGLTQEERNAALGRIFGNESLLAATLLYDGGATAINEWTDAVDDSGYAAEQAAMRQDNLAGDIEKLGGAFDTALIQTGSGANAVLRDMTQNATALVDIYGEMPEPLHQIALGSGVAIGAVTLLAGAAVSGRAKFLELKEAFNGTSVSMKRTALIGAGAGLALAGVITVVSLLAARQAEATARADAYAEALDRGKEGARDLVTEALTAEQSWLWMSRGSAADAAEKFGISLERLGDAALGDADALAEMADVIAAGQGDTAAAERLAAKHGLSLLEVSSASTLLAETLDAEAIAQQKGADKRRQANEITEKGAEVTKTAAEAYVDAANGAEELEGQLQHLIETVMEANGVGQDAVSANITYRDAVEDVQEQIDKARAGAEGYAITLDQNTQAGRDNLGMLVEMASKSQEAADAQFALDNDTEGYRRRLEEGRQTLIDRAQDLGYNAEQAGALADQIYRIPPDTEWEMIAKTADAAVRLQGVVNLINSIPSGKTFTLGASVSALGSVIQQADGGKVEYFADGGRRGGENHVAQFARAGTYRVWAEDETGGEWYLPESPAKRDRSVAIAREMAAGWGYDLVPQSARAAAPAAASSAPSALPETITLVDESGALLGRMRVVAQSEVTAARRAAGLHLSAGESSR